MLRVLFVSESNKTERFIKWATEKLFTIQMGEENKKDELASELLGVNHATIKNVFRTNVSKTPCVYLYLVGNAKELISDKYSDNDIVCKFGCTDDLPRRTSEHDKFFKKEFNKKVQLLMFSIIEAKYIYEAENSIKQFFKSNKLEYKYTKELIVLNKDNLDQVKQHYRMIQNSYIGQFTEMVNKVHDLEKQILEYQNQIILKDKEIELINEKHKNELKDRDIELLQFKIKMMENR